jgi:hypothetical protein
MTLQSHWELEKIGDVSDNAAIMVRKIARGLILGSALSVGMAACAPATGENAAVTATIGSDMTALAPLATASPDGSGEVPPATSGDDSPIIEDSGQVAPAGSIDLRELTADSDSAGAAGDFVELPAPGAPDPLAKAIQLAREDLSVRLRTNDLEETVFVEAEAAIWSDRSLGCPRPNTGYLAEETPGFKIILSARGEHFTYHSDLGQNVVLCLNGEPAPLLEG